MSELDDLIDDPLIAVPEETFAELVEQAEALGYRVWLVEYCESPDTPGLLGQGLGSIHYASKTIRIREGLGDEHRRQVLAHELEHARRPDAGTEIDAEWWDRRIEALADELDQ